MKITSIKTPIILLICLAGYIYYANHYQQEQTEDTAITGLKISEKEKNSVDDTNKKAQENKPAVSADAQYIVDATQPLNSEILRDEWQSQYGCYSANTEVDEGCNNSYLTAASYEEALWMQRHGYPSRSGLKLLEDPVNFKYIQELANKNKYTPAMALLAIHQLNNHQYKKAANMTLNLRAHTASHKTFPYRIRGEALLSENKLALGLSSIKAASILGDGQAIYIFNRYLHKYPSVAIQAADHANLYLGRVFGIPPGQFPHDARPHLINGG